MQIVVAGRTAPNRAVRFGGEGDRLDARGRRDVAALVGVIGRAPLTAGPELSVVQSAEMFGGGHVVEPRLSSLDVGRWRTAAPPEVPADELEAWFTDPTWAGHGGESIVDFISRVRGAAATVGGRTLVVAKPVAQALRCGGAADFFAVDLRPASIIHVAV